MHDAADDAAVVRPLDAPYIRRQMRLDPSPLLIAQPKQVPAHNPDPLPKTNQDRIVRAKKLMSSDPSQDAHAPSVAQRDDLESLSDRIKELSDKSTQLLLFLSFAMVSVATLEAIDNQAMKNLHPVLNSALWWWKLALIPTLAGVPPVKEICRRKTVECYGRIRCAKAIFLWAAVTLIFIGIVRFIQASP
jgi:hypothetical protein